MLMIIAFVSLSILWFVKGEDLILSYIRQILDIILIRIDKGNQEKVKQKFEELRNNYKNKKKNLIKNNPPKKSNNNIETNKIEDLVDNENIENTHDENNEQNNNDLNEKDDIISSENKMIENDQEFLKKKGPKKNTISIRSVALDKENKINKKLIIKKNN